MLKYSVGGENPPTQLRLMSLEIVSFGGVAEAEAFSCCCTFKTVQPHDTIGRTVASLSAAVVVVGNILY